MQKWLIDQQKQLIDYPDFYHEATHANEITSQINEWTDQSLTFSKYVMFLAQTALFVALWSIALTGEAYILGVVAMAESAVIVYAWIMFQRYYRTRGMCYAVNANVIAMHIHKEHTESDNECQSSTPDERRNSRDSNFSRRQDD